MDVKDATYHTKIDPSGIHISGGVGNDIILDGESGRVGIGTTSPAAKLEVNGDIISGRLRLRNGAGGTDFTLSQIAFGYDGKDTWRHHIASRHSGGDYSNDNALDFHICKGLEPDDELAPGTKNVMTIAYDGVGIGTSAPKATLNVNNTMAPNDNTIRPAGTGDTVYPTESLWLGKSSTSVKNYWGMSLGTTWNKGSYIQNLSTKDTNVYYNLLLQPNGGNVGIGTTDPQNKLEVNGGNISLGNHLDTTEISRSVGVFNQTTTLLGGMEIENTTLGGNYSQKLHFCTHRFAGPYGRRMTINEDGNVGIGTTAPVTALHVGTDYANTDVQITVAKASGYSNSFRGINIGGYDVATNRSEARIQCSFNLHIDPPDGHHTYLNLYEQGNIYALGSLHVASDERIKTNIEVLDDNEALEMVKQLETKKYTYIDKKTEKKRIGWIAQDVLKIMPDAVSFITNTIPNVFDTYNCSFNKVDGNLYKINIPDWEGEEGRNYRLIVNKFSDDNTFSLNGEYKNGCFEIEITNESFNIDITTIFIYGKEVDDFHTIDKNQIFALHHSAIQELSRRNDTLVAENTQLKTRMETLEAAVIVLQNK